MKAFEIFDKDNHLQPNFDKKEFENLHGWDFGWEILSTINIAKSSDEDEMLSRRFSPGQKALYFFWYLDAQVTNGGFSQFYSNGYEKYLPTIIKGLKLIGDNELLDLIDDVEKAYLARFFGWKRLFDNYNTRYYKLHNNTMALIENYARKHPEEFVKVQ